MITYRNAEEIISCDGCYRSLGKIDEKSKKALTKRLRGQNDAHGVRRDFCSTECKSNFVPPEYAPAEKAVEVGGYTKEAA